MKDEKNDPCTCQHGRWLHAWSAVHTSRWGQCHGRVDGERCECGEFEAAS